MSVLRQSVTAKMARRTVWALLFVGLAGLIAGAGGRFSPDLDLLANLRAHFIGLSVFAAMGLVLDYRPVLVTALGVFLTLSGHALLARQNEGPLLGTAQAAFAARPGDWTVLALNTSTNHPDPAGLADYLAAANADILVLTEFGPNKIGLLHQLALVYPYRQDCAADWGCAVAVLSRHPFAAGGTASAGAGPALAWITFGQGAAAVTIMGIRAEQPLRSPSMNARQLIELGASARHIEGRLLIAGDFNTTPWSNAFARFVETSGLVHMARFLPTFPSGTSGLPQLAIDHMFASPGISFDDVWIGPDVGSDHRPLLAEVNLSIPAERQAAR